jgi:glyoxylase-like metal-dependent hydrolase (beta-lactamase superfamily II)
MKPEHQPTLDQPTPDRAVANATFIVETAVREPRLQPIVQAFFDAASNTISYVVHDPASLACAIIDSVLDFDAASGKTATRSAQVLVDYVRLHGLKTAWLLETHVHADHLSAAPWLQAQLGGTLAIGRGIVEVQKVFATVFNAEAEFARDGSQFDRLFDDGDAFELGALAGCVLSVPGHTPACSAYVIGDAIFLGDTLFMPDYGTARCDFPGGSASVLYQSVQRVFALPSAGRTFACHDYLAPGREHYAWESSIGAQRAANVHVHSGVAETAFVAMRRARDATLPMPKLLLPAVQVNMRAGQLPPPEANGTRYLKLPLNQF